MSLAVTAIRLAAALIPANKLRCSLRDRWLGAVRTRRLARLSGTVKARYATHEARCRTQLARGEKLRAVFFRVRRVDVFGGKRIRANALRLAFRVHDCGGAAHHERRGVFAYDIRKGARHAARALRRRRARALRPGHEKCAGLDGEVDVVFSSIFYDDQSFAPFTVEAMSAYALVMVISYSYTGLLRSNIRRFVHLFNVVLAWRLSLSNREIVEELTPHNPVLAANARVCGYAKMDRYVNIEPETRKTQKTVLLCPHHTIERDTAELRLSTFLEYSDFYLRLPAMYLDVKFVSWPHPLLFARLRTSKWWGEERTARYEREMESHANVELQCGDDYFETFACADALVHDCGSFLAEYFYTGKPQCYLLVDGETAKRELLPFGERLLDATCKAFPEKDVTDFIDRVVLGGSDPLARKRKVLAEKSVCVYYPHASRRVVEVVCEGIAGGAEEDK